MTSLETNWGGEGRVAVSFPAFFSRTRFLFLPTFSGDGNFDFPFRLEANQIYTPFTPALKHV